MQKLLLAIDQGTTSTRAMIFSESMDVITSKQITLTQYFPQSGWVEHDPEEIWQTTLECCQYVLQEVKSNLKNVAAIGITNQRETTVLWNKNTGKPVYRAIVWQDRRTTDFCESLKVQGFETIVREKTGLLIDPYFSATKIRWILANIPQAKELALANNLCFGTIDSFLLWRLTQGKSHFTDITNAARTSLFNIKTLQWDEELLALFDIPKSILPQVLHNTADFGVVDSRLFGSAIPITGMIGDQQSAAVGQACFEEGMAKSTYGTGCFLLMNIGKKIHPLSHQLLVTPLYNMQQELYYALEGSIFIAGAAIQWLRDQLGLIKHAEESEQIAASVEDGHGVFVVPAFTGLGAPYWQPEARGAILGLTRDSNAAQIVRATLEAIAFQTKDLILAMSKNGVRPSILRVDGGMVNNNWLMQFLADILQITVERPKLTETTAVGAALVAGLTLKIFQLNQLQQLLPIERTFTPQRDPSDVAKLYRGWEEAVQRVR